MLLTIEQINSLISSQDSVIEGLLAAQERILSGIENIGVIITRERYLEEPKFVDLIRSQNPDRAPRGIVVMWQQILSQKKGPRVGTVQQRHRFSYEIYEPFNDDIGNGRESFDDFLLKYQRVNSTLNNVRGTQQPWNLGITAPGSDVEHQFLQGDGDAFLKQFGTGSGSFRTHYISNTLDVLVVVGAYGG